MSVYRTIGPLVSWCSSSHFAAAYKISSYLSERKGERDEMQDAHLILEDYSKEFADLHPSM